MMGSLNRLMEEYQTQLAKGQIQKAYKAIMSFMTALSSHLAKRCPDYAVSALYQGFMDMTYFAFTPPELKRKQLKIAVVYLHEVNRFEIWLSGSNRRIQAEYIALLQGKELGEYKLSEVRPGVDSILESILVETPDFDGTEELMEHISEKLTDFIKEVSTLLP